MSNRNKVKAVKEKQVKREIPFLKIDRKRTYLVVSIVLFIFLLALVPLDVFTHGYYCDLVSYEQIDQKDIVGYVDLKKQEYKMTFSPAKNHFAGVALIFSNQPAGNTGEIEVSIYSDKKKLLKTCDIDLTKINENVWYRLKTHTRLKKGKEYQLTISAKHCSTYPTVPLVATNYIPTEVMEGNALMGFAYAESTFSVPEKVLIGILLLALWSFCIGANLMNGNYRTYIRAFSVYMFLVVILSWNFMFNSMDNQNAIFAGFQSDSESLVTNMIKAENKGVDVGGIGYGLGSYASIGEAFANDDVAWHNGYSLIEPVLLVPTNPYTTQYMIEGNYVNFSTGDSYRILNVADDGANLTVTLDSDEILTESKYGSLSEISLTNEDGEIMPKAIFTGPYTSQIGLQGLVFRHMARHLNGKYLMVLNFLCAVLLASVLVMLVVLIGKKFNYLLAICYFFTFWLSPWVVSFARNLYWVSFTWFLPMLIGLVCSIWISDRKVRTGSFLGIYFSICLKSMCGYEYMTVIMLSAIVFLVFDFGCALMENDYDKTALIFKTTFRMGIAALAGFFTAILIHAPLKGNGNVWLGIKTIIANDVLRRTMGADLNNFDPVYWDSFNASIWKVFCTYFHFSTEIITGLTGNLFPLLCILPLCIFVYDYIQGKKDVKEMMLYSLFFLTSISWFCLAKSHSYVHTHMNYVLWYFGFVQICIYVIVNKLYCLMKAKENVR